MEFRPVVYKRNTTASLLCLAVAVVVISPADSLCMTLSPVLGGLSTHRPVARNPLSVRPGHQHFGKGRQNACIILRYSWWSSFFFFLQAGNIYGRHLAICVKHSSVKYIYGKNLYLETMTIYEET